MADFNDVYKCASFPFAGLCVRQHMLNYFESEPDQSKPDICCTGCEISESFSFQNVKELPFLLKCLLFLETRGFSKVYEKRIVDWLHGDEENWMWMHFNKEDLREEASFFGCLSGTQRTTVIQIVKGILRQCFASDYLAIEYETLPAPLNLLVKIWILTEEGKLIANEEKEPSKLPDPIDVCNLLLK